ETLPGIDVTSAPPRASSWQLTHEMPVGCPLGARAGDDGRPSASTCVAGPEKRGSKNILCPSATASRLPANALEGSGGAVLGRPVSDCSRCHWSSEKPQPGLSQNASSTRFPHADSDAVNAIARAIVAAPGLDGQRKG